MVNYVDNNTDAMVSVTSAKSSLVYAASQTGGNYRSLGFDWTTGEFKARWPFPDDSRRWNTWANLTTLLHSGDFLLGGCFTLKL